ncbi:hypothetical protein [Microbacterium sp.]|uniref:hypothetical protein n=1 Tax=Microbacterium sp. TaxID=51671 RepID=UPI003A85C65A
MRTTFSLRIVLPSVWIGLLLGLSFIEPTLKFQAPGITIPLGLGIGRLVFWAMSICGWLLLLTLTALAFRAPRVGRGPAVLIGVLWIVLLVQTIGIRPALSARSDVIIAGGDPGDSILHYVYIGTDVALLGLLVALLVMSIRALPLTAAASERR